MQANAIKVPVDEAGQIHATQADQPAAVVERLLHITPEKQESCIPPLLGIAPEDWTLPQALLFLRELAIENDELRARLAVLDVNVPESLRAMITGEGEMARLRNEGEIVRRKDEQYSEEWK